jgi:hypothetical protein
MTIDPSRRRVEAHLSSARFLAGVAAGRWRLVKLDWPHVIIAISAAARQGSPEEYAVRFELEGYPDVTPAGGIWDSESGTSLAPERRPKGTRAAQLFRSDWGGGVSMYAPFDRAALESHANWPSQYLMTTWTPLRDLTFILIEIHETLNADDYLGA